LLRQAVAAAWALAKSLGVQTLFPFRAAAFRADGPSAHPLVLSEDGASIRARSLIVAPGAWLSGLTSSWFGISVPTRVSAETVCYFAPVKAADGIPPPDHTYRSMPVFIFQTDNGVGEMSGMGVRPHALAARRKALVATMQRACLAAHTRKRTLRPTCAASHLWGRSRPRPLEPRPLFPHPSLRGWNLCAGITYVRLWRPLQMLTAV